MDGSLFKSFREVPVWQEAMDVAEVVFKLSEDLSQERRLRTNVAIEAGSAEHLR